MSVKVVIVEDDRNIQAVIKTYIGEYADDFHISEICRSVSDSVRAIYEHKPQLVFMDVEIKEGSGFDVLEKTTEHDYHTIFVTGHSEFAIDALRAEAIDYILKPIVQSEFCTAIDRFRSRYDRESSPQHRIVIEGVQRLTKVDLSEIMYISFHRGYCTFHLSDGREINSTKHLSIDTLSEKFVQIHRKHIVNIEHVTAIDPGRGGTLTLSDGRIVPIAYRRKSKIKQIWEQYY